MPTDRVNLSTHGRRLGRPPKRSLAIRQTILRAIELGHPHSSAYKLAHISHDTFQRWMDQDALFRDDVDEADAKFINANLEVIADARKKWWAAAAWSLERRFPQDFAVRQVLAIEGSLVADMEKRLNAGRERISRERRAEGVPPSLDGSDQPILQ